MIFGFNTDVRVGETVYHVQTEDRGPSNPVIDTTIYTGGRVIHRRATSYKELLESPEFNEESLHERLEVQHSDIIEDLRSGSLKFELPAPEPATAPPAGIHVQLLNPASWLKAGTATLEIEVRSRAKKEPVPEADIQATVQGMEGPLSFNAKTDGEGRAEMSFPLPRIGPGGTELVIRASAPAGGDEIRYALRPKPRPPGA